MSKNNVRATLTKYHKFWHCPKARIKALIRKHAYYMVRINNAESGFWATPRRADF